MNAKNIACVSLLTLLALRPAYGDNKKKDQPQNAPQSSKQQLIGGSRQQGNVVQQATSGGKHGGHSSAGSQGISRSTERSVQTRSGSRSTARSEGNHTQERSSRSRGASPDAVSRVYNFHGRHRGGGRYVDGRLVGRYANDRVYVNGQWYVWQAPPLAIFGLGTYGWVADEGGGEYAESAGPVEGIEPVIIGEEPGYYVVETGHGSRRIAREDFYRRYPRYTRVHELRSHSAMNSRGTGRVTASRGGPTYNRVTKGTVPQAAAQAQQQKAPVVQQPDKKKH